MVLGKRGHRFWWGLCGGLSIFTLVNALAVSLRSDGGLFGPLPNDGIHRTGFPFLVQERGGFSHHSNFYPRALIADLVIALAVSVVAGIAWHSYTGTARKEP